MTPRHQRPITRRKLLAASAGVAFAVPAAAWWLQSSANASTSATLPLDLVNTTGSDTVYAYVLGRDPAAGGNWAFIQGDGSTLYHPPSPANDQTPLGVDCAIALNASGAGARTVTMPHLDSGRIYFSVGAKLTFLINRGGGLALPSVSNPSDPNINVRHDFCEFTYNSDQLYANITFVDMVCLPISFRLETSQGTQTVRGLPSDGLNRVAAALRAQSAADGSDWNRLIVSSGGSDLRVVSPNLAIRGNSSLFAGYFDDYVNKVWDKYRSTDLRIDTQFTWGTATGRVSGDQLYFPGVGSFAKPSTLAVFSCSDAPFTTGNDEMGNLSARLAAALNRTTLLDNPNQPDGENPAAFYTAPRTNHYARILHTTTPDGLGYAFPYDDVHPAGVDFEGKVQSGTPSRFTITVGGSAGGGGGGGGNPTPTPTATGGGSAFTTIQAESFSAQSGTAVESCSDTGGGQDVGWLANGDWLKYSAVAFGNAGATRFSARVASGAAAGISGLVEVRLGSPTATPLGSFAIASTGGWQNWRTVPADISKVTGTHDVYLTFTSGQPADFVNLNWFTFN
ncbi:beta-1,3-glucanase family protein [Kitasatospora atroaurantiaca]|uniref:Carbohydrate binding protein with CBM6 domain n=1 Tax=Kitasatospora atroaurantiaca TaxID=285545 RepID=A0A561EXF4_9ACTN|nr:beta-1,3-glucanase family protein [Kitasatospora atroaurantiaca]TWE20296.1 carbohydrate binding protein with CBM6 domain [Kitasatospora atroaurantiaca]